MVALSFACAHKQLLPQPSCNSVNSQLPKLGRFSDDKIVARWGDVNVTYGQILEKAGGEIRTSKNKYLSGLYEKEMETLNAIVSEKLLRKDAEDNSVSFDVYMNQLRQSAGEVNQEIIQKFYEANRSRIKQDYETVRPEIAKYLTQEKQKEVITEKLERLYADARVELLLDEPDLLPFNFELASRPQKGAKEPLVTVVEFSDFECPYCRIAANDLERRLKKFGEQIALVFMHYPLSFHKNAMPAAVASECAHQQGAFWAFHDKVFEEQSELANIDYAKLAADLALDVDKFATCFKDPATKEVVQRDMAQGMQAGVRGTPSVFLNGIKSNRGVPSDDELQQLIDQIKLRQKLKGQE